MNHTAIKAIQQGFFDISFYNDKCQSASIKLSDIHSYEDFLHIPFTVKDDLRNTSPYDRTLTSKKEIYGLYSSSGTTGQKTFYVYNHLDRKKQAEFVNKYFKAIGMKEGGLGAIFAPIGSAVMGHCMMWQFQVMNMGMTICPDLSPESIVETISKLPVTDIATLPRVASSLSDKKEWRDIAKRSHVERFVLGGDYLSNARRKIIEETWEAKVYDSFGMSEAFGPLANECKMQDGLHYIDDDLFIEIIDPITGIPAKNGQVGIGVYTTLWEKGFPLLRYWSGDLFKKIDEPCPCGCGLPRLEYFGRACDCVFVDDTYVSPKQVEEITLNAEIKDCKVRVYEKHIILEYNESGKVPDIDTLDKLSILFNGLKIKAKPVLYDKLELNCLKPKLIIDCR